MSEFVTVAKVGDIPEGRGWSFAVGKHQIAVFCASGRYYALEDHCPHMGASLAVGDVQGDTVVCLRHQWAFKLADGSCLDAPALKAKTIEVRVEGDEIQVRLAVDG